MDYFNTNCLWTISIHYNVSVIQKERNKQLKVKNFKKKLQCLNWCALHMELYMTVGRYAFDPLDALDPFDV